MIAHSCGGQSVALNMLYPYPEPKAKMKVA